MRLPLVLTLAFTPAVLLGQATTSSVPPSAATPIFREVVLTRDTLALGRPLGRLARFARSARDTSLTIPAREFGGADEIEVTRDIDGPVRRMVFLYTERRDVRGMLEDYRASLGTPADSSVQDTRRGRWHTWTWRDAQTEFRFVIIQPTFETLAGLSILSERGYPLVLP